MHSRRRRKSDRVRRGEGKMESDLIDGVVCNGRSAKQKNRKLKKKIKIWDQNLGKITK
jgi:hypothetical protein